MFGKENGADVGSSNFGATVHDSCLLSFTLTSSTMKANQYSSFHQPGSMLLGRDTTFHFDELRIRHKRFQVQSLRVFVRFIVSFVSKLLMVTALDHWENGKLVALQTWIKRRLNLTCVQKVQPMKAGE